MFLKVVCGEFLQQEMFSGVKGFRIVKNSRLTYTSTSWHVLINKLLSSILNISETNQSYRGLLVNHNKKYRQLRTPLQNLLCHLRL